MQVCIHFVLLLVCALSLQSAKRNKTRDVRWELLRAGSAAVDLSCRCNFGKSISTDSTKNSADLNKSNNSHNNAQQSDCYFLVDAQWREREAAAHYSIRTCNSADRPPLPSAPFSSPVFVFFGSRHYDSTRKKGGTVDKGEKRGGRQREGVGTRLAVRTEWHVEHQTLCRVGPRAKGNEDAVGAQNWQTKISQIAFEQTRTKSELGFWLNESLVQT